MYLYFAFMVHLQQQVNLPATSSKRKNLGICLNYNGNAKLQHQPGTEWRRKKLRGDGTAWMGRDD